MSFIERHATYKRHKEESAIWKLLRANNAPFILAFLSDLFDKDTRRPYNDALSELMAVLKQVNLNAQGTFPNPPAAYLREWIDAGWLRNSDEHLILTDASQSAILFVERLEDKTISTSASHLRIVQEAVKDFTAALTQDPQEKIHLLEMKRAQIESEIKSIEAGVVEPISTKQLTERLREIYQQSSVLTNDFLRMEEDIRSHARDIRIKMKNSEQTRGEVLQYVMDHEESLLDTEAGSAFEAFYNLLCDENRTSEFRSQIKRILDDDIAASLSREQRRYMSRLIRELTRQSDSVFEIRRRTEQSLRTYIEQANLSENKTIDLLLAEVEKIATSFKEGDIKLSTPISLTLPLGAPTLNTPLRLRAKQPMQEIEGTLNIVEPKQGPSQNILNELCKLDHQQVINDVREILHDKGPTTFADLVASYPIKDGLEELILLVRLAHKTKAAKLPNRQKVVISCANGKLLEVEVDGFVFDPDAIPENIEELI